MTSQIARAVTCVALLLLMSASPLMSTASAHSSILLSVDTNHVVMSPGESANITLSIENNASSIESYNITIDDSTLATYWEVIPTETVVNNVFPTWSKNTTIIVRLSEGATVSDSGEFTVIATEPGANVSSAITVFVTVAPAYHPSLSPTANGLTPMFAGASTNLTFDATNLGTVTDTFLLDVEVQPDLAAWWANHSNSTGGNSSGNGTGNNTGGNISQVWSTPVTLDSTYNVGEQSSLAIDSNNHLHVTYLDYTSFNLEYVTYDGSSWSTPVSLDSTGDVGWQSSLAIDSNDNLHVTYYDVTYDNLEYMTYDGSSWSTPVSIDSTGDIGAMSSLAIDSNDHLHVTYLDNTNGNLEYMTYDGSSWSTPVTLDNGYNVGYYSSLAIDSNDNLHVTYQDELYDNLEYVTYDGSSWSSPVTLDSTDDLGYHSSLAIDSNDNLHVTYLDYTNYNLEYMTYDGSSWSTPVSIDSTDDVGWQSSLAIDSNDNLHVTYLDNTNDNLEYMTHDGSSWSTPVSLDSTDDVGSHSSLAIDSNDNLHVTYYDYTNDNLEYMFSSNSAGGNNTGGNGTGGANTTSSSLSVLMYGNSYTGANGLDALVESIIDASGVNGTVDANSGGGMSLAEHEQNVATAGHQWNTTLRNAAWDYVVLQDQSQIPSLPTNDSNWTASKNGAVDISTEIEAEGAESVLFMTWGRRSGESGTQWHQYNINQNFTVMQERLTEGYTRYAENMSAAGNTVWIAPVGLAFKTIHDSVEASGTNATQSGNLFYDLYTSDGSHPSLQGSYLAACVLFSTMSGEVCSASNDTVSLNASIKLQLQQASDDTVFNQTTGMSYYPWEITGTSAFGMGSSIPNGWYLQWDDDELSQMAAGSTQTATLSVTVPADAAPDFYGYRLTMGSTNGNVTTSTIIVIEVVAEPAIALAFLQQSDAFLSGSSSLSAMQVTNTGNTAMDLSWALTTDVGSLCTPSLVDAETLNLQPNEVTNLSFMVDVHETADSSDQCTLNLAATLHQSGTTSLLEELEFIVEIDEAVNFSLAGPINIVDIVPSEGGSYEIRLSNHGSDQALFFLDINESLGLDTVLVTASGVTVGPGQVGTWTVHTEGDVSLSGLQTQTFSVEYGGHLVVLDVEVNLLEVASLSLSAGSEDRLLIQPGQIETMLVNITNTGTSNLSLSVSLLNLPADVSVSMSETTVLLGHGESSVVNITFTAQAGALASTTEIELQVSEPGRSESLVFDLIVVDREDVLVTSLQDHLFANPLTSQSMSVEVINLGTATEVFVIDWSTTSASSWFEFTRSRSSLTLGPGASETIDLSVIEIAPGAPADGLLYTFTVTSSTNPSNTDSLDVTVQPATAGANITAVIENGEARPGQSIFGTLTMTNTGNVEDTLSISTVGADCGLDTNVTLGAGLSSPALGWSCVVSSDAEAGQQAITFRAVSSMRSNVAVEYSVLYEVEADWPGNTLVAVSFEDAKVSLGVDSSTTTVVTVQNLGNTEVSGTLDVLGKDGGLVLLEWLRLSDQEMTNDYTLTAGSSIDFTLTIISNTARTGNADLTVRATSSAAGVITSDESVPLQVSIEGPALPPNGLALPLGVSVSQPITLSIMGVGWLLALVLLQLRRRSAPKEEDAELIESSDDEEDDEVKDQEELGFNECRLDGDNKVSCPTCEARLGVPRGSEPPFRFTCPKCSNKIRVVE